MNYVTGNTIKRLREKNGYTQKQLAQLLDVSDKTVSKWETQRGLPDISLITELARQLRVSVAELLTGAYIENKNRAGNLSRMNFYVCPICGNVLQAVGKGSFHCCGVALPELDPEGPDIGHEIVIERMDQEHYVTLNHDMNKEHYISFIAYVTDFSSQLIKFYPEQNAGGYLQLRGRGKLYAYCNRHGLFCRTFVESCRRTASLILG